MSSDNVERDMKELFNFNASHTDEDIKAALSKSSGVDGDAGDWTKTGDGTEYPKATGSNFVKPTIQASDTGGN